MKEHVFVIELWHFLLIVVAAVIFAMVTVFLIAHPKVDDTFDRECNKAAGVVMEHDHIRHCVLVKNLT